MVSNFERILVEIRREADVVGTDQGLAPGSIVELIMSIVDVEDRHRIRTEARINQKVKGMIQNVALANRAREEA